MKDFNLDNLERKTPYKVPDNFFEEMQENVLKQTTQKQIKQTKIFRLNYSFVTSLAAAIALVFGFTFLWKTNQTDITKPAIEDTIAVNTVNQNIKNSTVTTKISTPEITKPVTAPKKEVAPSETTKIAEQIVNSKNTDENYEQLLNSLTEEELTELSKNTDHDIYLELYN